MGYYKGTLRMKRLTLVTLYITACILVTCWSAISQPAMAVELFPDSTWYMYASPEEAGWSSEKLILAERLCDSLDSDAMMVVYDGAVLMYRGDISRRYMCHSVRKSFLSALYGIFVGEGAIDTSLTIGELGVDDDPPLTADEKMARIADLLKARSGIYHAAAYETPSMKKRRPERGSKRPGEFWYYNNWDFNALGTIFRLETGVDLFTAFKERIAEPLMMEDFRLMDTYYHLERQYSIHPAYPFRMSARDMARFGLLYLRKGRWKGRQIIPASWVEASSKAYSIVPYWKGYGYGFLWWVNTDRMDRKYGMYMALGYGGHAIAVLPRERLVVVNRPNTYIGKRTRMAKFLEFIDALLDARVSEPNGRPELFPLEVKQAGYSRLIDRSVPLRDYEGSFELEKEEIFDKDIPYVLGDILGNVLELEPEGEKLLMKDSLGQKYYLVPLSREKFLIEDMDVPIVFELDRSGRPVKLTLDASPAWRLYGRRTGDWR